MTLTAKENVPARKLRLVKTGKDFPSDNGGTDNSGMALKLSAGDYTAAEFMAVWRRAKDRNEQIQAIHGYTGYDNRIAFSINEYNAISKAKKALAPVRLSVVKDPVESKGYVAGLPDNQFKRIADLMGREKMAIENLKRHKLTASNMKEGSEEKFIALGLAEVEKERLAAIRADLSLLIK